MEYGHIMSALFVACIAFGSGAFKRGVQWGVFFSFSEGVDMLWGAQGTEDLGEIGNWNDAQTHFPDKNSLDCIYLEKSRLQHLVELCEPICTLCNGVLLVFQATQENGIAGKSSSLGPTNSPTASPRLSAVHPSLGRLIRTKCGRRRNDIFITGALLQDICIF